MEHKKIEQVDIPTHEPRMYKLADHDAWMVESENEKGKFYVVEIVATCECKAYEYKGGVCKHIKRVIEAPK